MTCATILSLIVLGGVILGAMAGTVTEIALVKAGYQPKDRLAAWRERWQAHSAKFDPA